MHLAIIYAISDMGETFCLSREIDKNLSTDEIVDLMCKEAQVTEDEVDTIIVVTNGYSSPQVIHHWSARNGDFS